MQGVNWYFTRSKLPVYSPLPNQIHTTRQKKTAQHATGLIHLLRVDRMHCVVSFQKQIHTHLLIARLLPCLIHAQTRHWSKPRVVDKIYFVVRVIIVSQQMHCQTTPLFNSHNIPMIQSISVWTESATWCHSQDFSIQKTYSQPD